MSGLKEESTAPEEYTIPSSANVQFTSSFKPPQSIPPQKRDVKIHIPLKNNKKEWRQHSVFP